MRPRRTQAGLALALLLISQVVLLAHSQGPMDCATQSGNGGAALGCPCRLLEPCGESLYCTSSANAIVYKLLGLPLEESLNYTLQQGGHCAPCVQGDFCPPGTSDLTLSLSPQEEMLRDLMANLTGQVGLEQAVVETLALVTTSRIQAAKLVSCPEGSFCPETNHIYDCPAGSFCPRSSVGQTSCMLPNLLLNSPAARYYSIETSYLYNSVAAGEALLEGNVCSSGSVDPTELCPAGKYCPTPAEAIECPEDFQCPEGSSSPTKCPWLASCPIGSASASISWGGFIIASCIVLLMAATILAGWLHRRWRDQTNVQRAEKHSHFREIMQQAGLPPPEFSAFQEMDIKVSVTFKDLTLTLNNGQKVLNGVTGRFPHSQLIAIMGGSGCGKSTFLNALCGKANYGTVGGSVLVNGHEAPLNVIRSIKGFVPQDDTVHEDLTVHENLNYAAAIRLPSSYSNKKRKDLIYDTCELLQMSHVMNSVVGSVEKRGISGGQRKRVNIGLELVAQPSVLFLDEPTSGLDATASLTVLNGLKLLSQRGLSSIMVIHQPRYSIFELCDKVLLLGYGGFQVYLGPSTTALPYFESRGFALPPNENPSDFFLDVIQGKVACADSEDFEVESLFQWWKESGPEWVQNNTRAPPLKRSASLQNPEYKRGLRAKFKELDTDKDNRLSTQEIQMFIQGLGYDCDKEGAGLVVRAMNGGLSNEVTMAQFVRYATNAGGLVGFITEIASKSVRGLSFTSTNSQRGPVNPDSSSKSMQTPSEPEEDPSDVEAHPQALELDSIRSVMVADDSKMPPARCIRGPGMQAVVVFRRSAKKWLRSWDKRLLDILIVVAVAIIIGVVMGSAWQLKAIPINFMQYLIALGVIICTASLRVFGSNQVMHWREVASGYSVLAVFTGVCAFDLLDIVLRPLLFSAVFYSLTSSNIDYNFLLLVSLLVAWFCSGLSYLLSILIPAENRVLAAAAIPIIMAGFLNGFNPSLASMGAYSPMHLVTYISYARWAIEALLIEYFRNVEIQFKLGVIQTMRTLGFCGFVFEDSGAVSNTNSSDMFGVDVAFPDEGVLLTSVIQADFPQLYNNGPQNASQILGFFERECIGVNSTICNHLDAFYNQYLSYSRCDQSAQTALIVLFGLGVLLRILAFLALKFCNRGQQV